MNMKGSRNFLVTLAAYLYGINMHESLIEHALFIVLATISAAFGSGAAERHQDREDQ
jgi:hypothetical protein